VNKYKHRSANCEAKSSNNRKDIITPIFEKENNAQYKKYRGIRIVNAGFQNVY
jgi:hypothetical protein